MKWTSLLERKERCCGCRSLISHMGGDAMVLTNQSCGYESSSRNSHISLIHIEPSSPPKPTPNQKQREMPIRCGKYGIWYENSAGFSVVGFICYLFPADQLLLQPDSRQVLASKKHQSQCVAESIHILHISLSRGAVGAQTIARTFTALDLRLTGLPILN